MQVTGTSAEGLGEGHQYEQVGGGGGGVAVSTWRLEEEEEGTVFQLKENEAYAGSNASQLKDN